MRPSTIDAACLWDMLTHAREVASIVSGRTFAEYQHDRLLRRATERVVGIVGEAAAQVSKEYRAATPSVPWAAIISQRHRLVHDYGRIDAEKIWRVATHYIPLLIPELERLLPTPPSDPEPEPPEG